MTCEESRVLGWDEWDGVRLWFAKAPWGCYLVPLYPLPPDAPPVARAHPIAQISSGVLT